MLGLDFMLVRQQYMGRIEHMYLTEVIWWSYTVFLVAAALFMLLFVSRVRRKGV